MAPQDPITAPARSRRGPFLWMSLPFAVLAGSLIWFLSRGTTDESAGLAERLQGVPVHTQAPEGLRVEAMARTVDVVRVQHSEYRYSAAIRFDVRLGNTGKHTAVVDLVITARDESGAVIGRPGRREAVRLEPESTLRIDTFTLVLDGPALSRAARLELSLE